MCQINYPEKNYFFFLTRQERKHSFYVTAPLPFHNFISGLCYGLFFLSLTHPSSIFVTLAQFITWITDIHLLAAETSFWHALTCWGNFHVIADMRTQPLHLSLHG